jgi:2-keto-4-pentenoate hydratase
MMVGHMSIGSSDRSVLEADEDAAAAQAAARIVTAIRTGYPCAPVRDLIGAYDVERAYRVQSIVTRVGRKIGLTSAAVQQQLGVDQPDFGTLFDDMAVADGATAQCTRLMQPRIEAEVAFILAHDLDRKGMTVEEITDAVAYAAPALEIVDSRIANWDISLADTVADNASSGLFVIGADRRDLRDFDPKSVSMTLRCNGDVVSSGGGEACLGDPLIALRWLAEMSVAVGDPLCAGEVILSGALGPMVEVAAGSTYEAALSGLGAVRATLA